MQQIHVLHLTDLHLEAKEPSWEQKVLLDALIEDLLPLKFTPAAPQLVVFSGDLAKGADASEAYDSVLGYLLKVVEAVGLDETRLIMCPGNHDASRSDVAPSLPALRGWRQQAQTISGANALVSDAKFRDHVARSFAAYGSLSSEFGKAHEVQRSPMAATHYLRDLGLSVISLNTAMLTGTGVSTDVADQGQLCVPERVLVEALDAGPKGVPAVVVGHHPTSWFNDENRVLVESVLAKRALIYFSGHLHDAAPKQVVSLSGSLLKVESGALHTARDRWNGYAVVSYDTGTGHARVAYRRWFEKRREFAAAIDLGDEGTFFSSQDARVFWSRKMDQIDLASLNRWQKDEHVPLLSQECNQGFSDHSLDTVFVPPDFEHEVPYRTEADGRVGARLEVIAFDQVVRHAENYIISARRETGKTTALKQLALLISRTESRNGSGSIPVYLQFSSIKPYVARYEAAIRQKLPDLPKNITVKRLLDEGFVTLLVDDVDFSKDDQRKALVAFVTLYPKCRYIFATSSPFVESSALKPEITPSVPFTKIDMRVFKQKHLMTLIERHGTTDPLQVDQIAERVVRDASALNVPLTAVTGTFLIQILQEDPDHLVLNQAAFIERYLEMVLQKYAPKELLPGTFDFTNKVDLLCYVAEKMVLSSEYYPPENTVLQWCIDYLKGYGLPFSAGNLVEYFVTARVFERDGECIRFRLRMFFEFFVARRMIDKEEFRDFIFDDDRYLSYINEIGFYAAISRRDKVQIERILQKFRALSATLWSPAKGVPEENEYLRTFKTPGRDTSLDELQMIQQEIRSPARLMEDRDEMFESVPLADDNDQSVVRATFATDEQKWSAHLLLLSGMLKHMELIPDEDKKEYLREILQGWVRFLVNSLGVISALAKDRRVELAGITYKSTLPEDLPAGEVGRRLALSMPIAAGRMATLFLGTEKLRLQLEDGLGSANEPAGRQFLRLAILADLGIPDISGPAAKASDGIKDQKFLQFALARKLYEAAVRFRLNDSELDKLRALVGEIHVALEGVPRANVDRRKAAIISGMNRQRLQIEYAAPKKE